MGAVRNGTVGNVGPSRTGQGTRGGDGVECDKRRPREVWGLRVLLRGCLPLTSETLRPQKEGILHSLPSRCPALKILPELSVLLSAACSEACILPSSLQHPRPWRGRGPRSGLLWGLQLQEVLQSQHIWGPSGAPSFAQPLPRSGSPALPYSPLPHVSVGAPSVPLKGRCVSKVCLEDGKREVGAGTGVGVRGDRKERGRVQLCHLCHWAGVPGCGLHAGQLGEGQGGATSWGVGEWAAGRTREARRHVGLRPQGQEQQDTEGAPRRLCRGEVGREESWRLGTRT